MSEEEIIKTLQVLIGLEEFNKLSYKENKALQGLLDLYNKEKLNTLNLSEQLNKEKEKNKKIEDKIKVKLEKLKGQKGQYRLMLEQEYKGLLEE